MCKFNTITRNRSIETGVYPVYDKVGLVAERVVTAVTVRQYVFPVIVVATVGVWWIP